MKVLIASPINPEYDYPLDFWLWWVYTQNNHKEFTALLAINGKVDDHYIEELASKNPQLMIINTECESPNLLERITRSRQAIMSYAKKWNYDKILFLDLDTIPIIKDLIPLLASHEQPFVTGWYTYKNRPSQLVATVWHDKEKSISRGLTLPEIRVYAEKGHFKKLIPLASTGFGCSLIDKELFNTPLRYLLTDKIKQGEDIAFCEDVLLTKGISPQLDIVGVCKHLSAEEPIAGDD